MLKPHNFQIPQLKRRRLYTPLSDEDENFELGQKKAIEKVNILKTSATENFNKIPANEQKVAVLKDEDEGAENLLWKVIKPVFRKDAVRINDKIWRYNYMRFNSIEIANQKILHKKNKTVEIHNYDHIMDVLTKCSAAEAKKMENNKSNQINASIVRHEKEEKKISHSSKNRLYSAVEIRQPHSSNDFSIKSLRSTINCDVLSNVFSQYEIKGNQVDRNIKKIDSSIKDSFIYSQFLDTTILNIHEIEAESDYGDDTKVLIDTNEVLNDLLKDSSTKRCEISGNSGLFSRSSILSESSKRTNNNGSLTKCFL